MELGKLSAAYESNGDPAIVSTGEGDFGGISYGAYQLASNCGSVDAFLGWGLRQEDGFYKDFSLSNFRERKKKVANVSKKFYSHINYFIGFECVSRLATCTNQQPSQRCSGSIVSQQ